MIVQENLEEKFEIAMKKLFPTFSLMKFKSGTYVSHDTYRMFQSYAEGYKEGIDKQKQKEKDNA